MFDDVVIVSAIAASADLIKKLPTTSKRSSFPGPVEKTDKAKVLSVHRIKE